MEGPKAAAKLSDSGHWHVCVCLCVCEMLCMRMDEEIHCMFASVYRCACMYTHYMRVSRSVGNANPANYIPITEHTPLSYMPPPTHICAYLVCVDGREC